MGEALYQLDGCPSYAHAQGTLKDATIADPASGSESGPMRSEPPDGPDPGGEPSKQTLPAMPLIRARG
jgi:hypothetical protein